MAKKKKELNVERAEIGRFALVQETEDGRIRQIGLTEDQSVLLQALVKMLSGGKPMIDMGKEYDLVLKGNK